MTQDRGGLLVVRLPEGDRTIRFSLLRYAREAARLVSFPAYAIPHPVTL